LTFKTTLASTLTAAALALAAPLAAQENAPAQMSAEDVTEAQVDAFVQAVLAIEEVRGEYVPKIKAESSEEAQQELAQEANDAAIQAVKDVDNITPDEYVAIGKVARADEALNKRIMARLQETQQE
jgi:hypothetical protein